LSIDLTPFRFYWVTPSPFIPLPLDKGKGEEILYKRGEASLGLSLIFTLFRGEFKGDFASPCSGFNNAGVFKRGASPSLKSSPSPY